MDVQQNVQISNMPPLAEKNLDALTREYADNKTQADALTARNAEIAEEFVRAAFFKDGSNTGRLEAGDHAVTVTRRFNVKWHQDLLDKARAELTDELFSKIFTYEYKPRSKADLDAFLNLAAPKFRALILAAMETSPGKPAVKSEVLQ